jgi:hypothetical protein
MVIPMTDESTQSRADTDRYADWKSQIRSELEAFEGEGPPTVDELWHVARYESESAASWIADMPATKQEIETVKDDLLRALVALEMAEERLNGGVSDD